MTVGAANGVDVIYFVRDPATSWIKIGFSNQVGVRLTALAAALPVHPELLLIVAGSRALEESVQGLFAAHRQRGEWFAPAAPLLAFIERLSLSGLGLQIASHPPDAAERYRRQKETLQKLPVAHEPSVLAGLRSARAALAEWRAPTIWAAAA